MVGLAADVGGYLLRASAATELVGLLGDLLYTLGWGLWTGAVVVVLLAVSHGLATLGRGQIVATAVPVRP